MSGKIFLLCLCLSLINVARAHSKPDWMKKSQEVTTHGKHFEPSKFWESLFGPPPGHVGRTSSSVEHLQPHYDCRTLIARLEDRITNLNSQVSSLQGQVTSLTSANSALTTQLQTVTQGNSALSSQLQGQAGTLTTTQQQLAQCNTALANCIG